MTTLTQTRSETDNGSVQADATVSHNTCQRCEEYKGPPPLKRYALGASGLHCTNCHGDRHLACSACGRCLPDGHRYHRRYCSSTCRVRAHNTREQKRLERAAWEAENPEEARRQAGEKEKSWKALVAAMRAIPENSDEAVARRKRKQECRSRAALCAARIWHPENKTASDCTNVFGSGDVIYRRRGFTWDVTSEVLPHCREHRCTQSDGRHNRDAPEGSYYPGCWCDDQRWDDPQPCIGCARLVSHPKRAAWRGRYGRYDYDAQLWVMPEIFCSEHCRRIVFCTKRKAKHLSERGDNERTCSVCKRMFKGRRADASYCSEACRQGAYRQRAYRRREPLAS